MMTKTRAPLRLLVVGAALLLALAATITEVAGDINSSHWGDGGIQASEGSEMARILDGRSHGTGAALLDISAQMTIVETTAGTDPPGDGTLELSGCLLTGTAFDRSADEVQDAYVPHGYRLGDFSGPGSATVVVWVFDCERARNRASNGRIGIALVGVQVQQRAPSNHPERLVDEIAGDHPVHVGALINAPTLWDLYVNVVLTNDGNVLRYLRAQGLPAQQARIGLAPADDYATLDRSPRISSVNWPRSPFETTVRPNLHDELTHHHHNRLYHGGDLEAAAKLDIHIPSATDRLCLASRLEDDRLSCGGVATSPQGWLAQLLGAAERDDPAFAFDHRVIERVTFSPVPGRDMTAPPPG